MKKASIIIVSLIISMVVMSSGYGSWKEKLTIKGRITVVEQVYSELLTGSLLEDNMIMELGDTVVHIIDEEDISSLKPIVNDDILSTDENTTISEEVYGN